MDTSLALKAIQLMDKMLTIDQTDPNKNDLYPIAEKLGAELAWGATRFAFIFAKHRVVVKFPRYEETNNDYCAIEMDNYLSAKEFHVERCLLPLEKVGMTKQGIPVYIQPMYSFAQGSIPGVISAKWRKKAQSIKNAPILRKVRYGCVYAPADLWLQRAIQIYGKAFMRSFQEWTRKQGVNDLHASNVGYVGKQPIIIDYAGYHD